jgi:hypothetical protein
MAIGIERAGAAIWRIYPDEEGSWLLQFAEDSAQQVTLLQPWLGLVALIENTVG